MWSNWLWWQNLKNVRRLLDSLASSGGWMDHHGFDQTDVGKKANKVYGTVLCKWDISVKNCFDYALNSTRIASSDCGRGYGFL
jgi:hypothetical protein